MDTSSFFRVLRSEKARVFFVFLFLLGLLAFVEARPEFPDPDSFYHAKMALILRDRGVIHQFPWFQFTSLKDTYVDPHLLYHVFLIPFVTFFDPLIGMKISAVLFGLAGLYALYRVLKQMKAPWPEFLMLATALSVGFFHRLSLPRAPALAVAFLVTLTWAMFRSQRVLLFVGSFLFVWFYHGWPVLLPSLGALLVSELVAEQILSPARPWKEKIASIWKKRAGDLLATLGGILCGFVLNPYFPQNLVFSIVDIFKIGVVNYQSKLPVGQEWYPMSFDMLFTSDIPILIAFVLAVALFLPGAALRKEAVARKEIVSVFLFLALVGGYVLLTLKSSRFIEYAIPFVALAVGALGAANREFLKTEIVGGIASWVNQRRWRQGASLVLGLGLVALFTAQNLRVTLPGNAYFSARQYDVATDWIKDHVPAGATVFHNSWDYSLVLFYLDESHYYLMGLDPTFMYEYDPDAFELWRNICAGKEDVKKIKTVFHASAVIVDTRFVETKDLLDQLDRSGLFEEVRFNRWIRVYAATELTE